MPDEIERLRSALADRYTIESEIGRGGMATVYVGLDVRHHRKVAIKVLDAALAAALGPDRFLREIEIAARLQHPHILPLFDSGEADGFLYYVMPYVSGESLRARLHRERELPIDEAVRILRDVADALAHAHADGVVHRDIKPDNVMLSGRHALVTDFGVAKAVGDAAGRDGLTTAGVALGTPAYMAPEQAVADTMIDHRADIYAFGALAYELLTGRPPFMGSTPQMVLSAQVTQMPDPVSQHRPSVPPDLAHLVMRCLEKKPADRWQRTEELVSSLEMLSTPSRGLTPTDTRPFATVRRRRALVLAASGAAIALGAFGTWSVLRPGASPAEDDVVAVSIFDNQTGDPSLDPVGRMASEEITNGLLRTGVVRVVSTESMIQLARSASQGDARTADPDHYRRLADETGAGLVISGAYYLDGDSLRFHAQLVDPRVGQVERAVGPVASARQDPRSAIAELSQRMMIAVGQRFNVRLGDLPQALSVPKSFAAYEAYAAGMDAFLERRFESAGRHFRDALAIDSTYADARLYLAVNQRNLGRLAEEDSLVRILEGVIDRLTPLQRAFVDLQRAWLDGDRRRALEAVRRGVSLAVSGNWGYQLAYEATRSNRPREAVRVLTTLDPERPDLAGWLAYWNRLTDAYHMLGEHEQELRAAQRAQAQYPESRRGYWFELQARAALGTIGADDQRVRELLEKWSALGGRRSQAMLVTAWELDAHGHADAARDMLERSLAWLRDLPDGLDTTQSYRLDRFQTLYSLGMWSEAALLLDSLAPADAQNVPYLAYLGTVAARRGDRAMALQISERLRSADGPYLGGANTYQRACIASLLGERQQAVALLRQAYDEGYSFSIAWHRDLDLKPLRNYPPYQELMHPKG